MDKPDYIEMKILGGASFKQEMTKQQWEDKRKIMAEEMKQRPFLLIEWVCKLMDPYLELTHIHVRIKDTPGGKNFFCLDIKDAFKEYLTENIENLPHFFIFTNSYIFFTRSDHEFGKIYLHKLPINSISLYPSQPVSLGSDHDDFTLGCFNGMLD